MHIFGLEIKKDDRVKEMTTVTCYRCAIEFKVSSDNLRVYNYCVSCK